MELLNSLVEFKCVTWACGELKPFWRLETFEMTLMNVEPMFAVYKLRLNLLPFLVYDGWEACNGQHAHEKCAQHILLAAPNWYLKVFSVHQGSV